jgi:hypothetical protein
MTRLLVNVPSAIVLAIRSGAPVVHLHDPELVVGIPFLRLLQRRVIFDAHEDVPEQVLDKPYIPHFLRRAASELSKLLVRLGGMADAVIAATPIVARRYPAHKTTVVCNFPILRAAELTLTPLTERPRRAVYIGVVSEERGSTVMQRATHTPAFPDDWHVALAGACYPAAHGDDLRGDGRLTIHGLLDPESARDLLLASRVGLVVLHPTRAYQQALATKMFEYLAAGLPIIASDFPVWRDILAGYDCAIFVDPEDPDAVAAAMAKYASNPALLETHGSTARRAAVERFNWAREEPQLLAVYQSLGLESRD